MFSARGWIVFLFMMALATTGRTVSGAVIIESWHLNTTAADYVDGPGYTSFIEDTVAMPFDLSRTATAGASESTSVYNFDVDGNQYIFRFGFTHVRDGDVGEYPDADRAYSSGSIRFSVSEPVEYSISGSYALHGSNWIRLNVYLWNQDQYEYFTNGQSSASTPDEYFVVGEQDGEFNTLVGAPNGTLLPGSTYFFSYTYKIEAISPDSGASATGDLELLIVPEPSSAWLLVLAGPATCLPGRRRARLTNNR